MGTELILGVALGFIILGPRRMQMMLGRLAQAKVGLDKVRREIQMQLTTEVGVSEQTAEVERDGAVRAIVTASKTNTAR